MNAALQSCQPFAAAVAFNCHISDAQFARNDTLCIYLLKMRELYRWEQKFGFQQPIDKNQLGQWLTAREEFWDTIEDQPLAKLPLHSAEYDPFDDATINQQLQSEGLFYGGGIGLFGKPTFVLGSLQQTIQHHDSTIYLIGTEYIRDITAPAAMSRGREIYIREQALHQLLWERYEEWSWKQHEGTSQQAFACYPFSTDIDLALDQMAQHEINTLIHHEMGEIQASQFLGEEWQQQLHKLGGANERIARALKDLLADCYQTLPDIIDNHNEASLHFYMANLSGFRKGLFPLLQQGYQQWLQTHQWQQLSYIVQQGYEHWQKCCQQFLHANLTKNTTNTASQWLEQMRL